MSTASKRVENAWQPTTLERMVVALMVVAILELAFNWALDESEHRISPWETRPGKRRVS
jgi:ABC-type nitrate/sulfonate/bicarbonate transport system permease component